MQSLPSAEWRNSGDGDVDVPVHCKGAGLDGL